MGYSEISMREPAYKKLVYWFGDGDIKELYDLPKKSTTTMWVWIDGRKVAVTNLEIEVTMP